MKTRRAAEAIEEAADIDATVAYDSTESSALAAAAHAEEGVIFDEETEAVEALDDESVDLGAAPDEEKPASKKGKGRRSRTVADEDAEVAEALADEDEDDSASRKKKGKKKELAAVAPPEARPSMALRWLRRMIVGVFLIAAGAGRLVLWRRTRSRSSSSPRRIPRRRRRR